MKIDADMPDVFAVVQHGCPGWVVMWCVALAIYAGFKWIVWRKAIRSGGVRPARSRSFIFLALWPGMDAERFLDSSPRPERPGVREWIWGGANVAFGAALLWCVASHAGQGLLAGWIGMTGMIFLAHFGLFKLLALFWQQNGICAQPLMRMPVAAKSVGDFWSKRWNSAFHNLSFGLLFRGFRKYSGVRAATMLTFITSGLIHDLVLSFPAGGGYGLPTAYFAFQGAGMLLEHSGAAVRAGLRGSWRGRLFAWAVVAGPVFALFPPQFILGVIVPFMRAIRALPGDSL